METIKLIALDLDGTLLHSDKTISAANSSAIQEAAAKGIQIVLASGRMYSATAKYAQQMEFPQDAYIVSYNGALARQLNGGSPLVSCPLDPKHADELIQFTQNNDLHLNYYLDDVLYTRRQDKWSDLYSRRTGCKSEFVGDLSRFNGCSPTKLVILDDGDAVKRLKEELSRRLGPDVQILITDDEYLEFMNPEATKANALAAIAKKLNIDQKDCVAFGDGYNDIPMLKWAGRGIAMSNGRPELLAQIAEHAPSADEDGVAVKIRELIA